MEADYLTNSVIDQHLIRYIHGWVVPRTSEPFINSYNKVQCYFTVLVQRKWNPWNPHVRIKLVILGQLFTTYPWLPNCTYKAVPQLIPVGRVLYFDPSGGLCLCGSPRLGVFQSKSCGQLNPAVCYRHCGSSPNQQSLEHTARNQDTDVDILFYSDINALISLSRWCLY